MKVFITRFAAEYPMLILFNTFIRVTIAKKNVNEMPDIFMIWRKSLFAPNVMWTSENLIYVTADDEFFNIKKVEFLRLKP